MEGNEWEQCKENFAPIRRGRPKAVLSEIPDAADSASKQALDLKKREMWKEVKDYSGDDPIEPWIRLVKWIQEHMAGSKVDLQNTLEAGTRELLKINKYRSDVRFLRLWVQYADCLPDPSDIFVFLREKKIGIEYALFYEAHGTYYELKGNSSAADAVYNEGINRCAKPLERLKQKYLAFQKRMAQRIQRRIQEEALMGAQPPPEAHRSSLATLGPVSVALVAPNSRGSNPRGVAMAGQQSLLGVAAPTGSAHSGLGSGVTTQTLRPAAAGAIGQLPSLLFSSSSHQRGSAAGGASIAVDDEFSSGPRLPSSMLLAPGLAAMPALAGGSGSLDLKPYNIMRKENTNKPGVWTNAAVPQNQLLVPPSHMSGGISGSSANGNRPGGSGSGRLEICIDDEFQDGDEPEPHSAPAAPQLISGGAGGGGGSFSAASGFLLPTTAAAELPSALGGFTRQQGAGAAAGAAAGPGNIAGHGLQQVSGIRPPIGALPAGAGVEAARKGNFGYDEALLSGMDGKEQSFEEARAAMYFRRLDSASDAHRSTSSGAFAGPLPQQQQQQQQQEQQCHTAAGALPLHQAPSLSIPPAAVSHAAASAQQTLGSTSGRGPSPLTSTSRVGLKGPGFARMAEAPFGGQDAQQQRGGLGMAPVPAPSRTSSRSHVALEPSPAVSGPPPPPSNDALPRSGRTGGALSTLGGSLAPAAAAAMASLPSSLGHPASAAAAAPCSGPGCSSQQVPPAVLKRRAPLADAQPVAGSSSRATVPGGMAAQASVWGGDVPVQGRGAAMPLQARDGGMPMQARGSGGFPAAPPSALHSNFHQDTAATSFQAAPSLARAGPPPDPTVTMSTRDAFDVLNTMFSAESDRPRGGGGGCVKPTASTGMEWPLNAASSAYAPTAADPSVAGSGWPAPGPPLGAPSQLPSGFSMGHVDEDETQQHHLPSSHMHAPEPTVTLSTREAFEALNDMFSERLPHEAGLKQRKTLMGLPAASKPISASDVCRLANKGKASVPAGRTGPSAFSAAAAAPLGPSSSAHPNSNAFASSFMIHEDTEFMAAAPPAYSGIGGMPSNSGGGRMGASLCTAASADMHPGLHIYEDTQFILPGMGGSCDNGGNGGGSRGPLPAAPPYGSGLGGGSGHAAPLDMMHEDTEFVTRDIVWNSAG